MKNGLFLISLFCLIICFLPGAQAQKSYLLEDKDINNYNDQMYIGIGDELRITFYEQESVDEGGKDVTVTVRDDGTIFLSLIGEVHALGKSPKSLENKIESKLKEFMLNPKVRVELVIDLKNQVSLLGATQNQGVFSIHSNMTISQFLAKYGGVLPMADLTRIYVVRSSGEIILVNLEQYLINGDDSQDIMLRGGDRVYLPENEDPLIVRIGRVAGVVNVVLQVLILALVIAN